VSQCITFRQLIASQEEKGAAFTAFYRGELVVDLWGGYADFEAGRYRQHDSISGLYSATKIAVAVSLAMLVDR
jgi:CubicO group peptidase (beta-lactamase class C family)